MKICGFINSQSYRGVMKKTHVFRMIAEKGLKMAFT